MSKEKICLAITVAICLFGCAFLSIFNVLEANYSASEIIRQCDYNVGISVSSNSEEAESSAERTEGATVNINTASAAQLAEFLPGIGEIKAQRIVEYREQAGKFVSVDELIKVDGIGEKTLENIRPYCRLSD